MAAIEIKGVSIGEGRTKTIVSLMDVDGAGLCATAVRAVEAGADCLEWRADFYAHVHDPLRVAEQCRELCELLPNTPLIFTLRTKGQGGQLELPPDEYVDLNRTVITSGKPDLVDIEVGIGDEAVQELVELAHAHGVRAIVSYHDFSGTPGVYEMESRLVHMASLGADIPKLAVMARMPADPRSLMQATARTHERLEQPLLTMSMGLAGQHTRLSGEVFGSALTFCALGQPSAPGQVELGEALVTLEALHRTVTKEK